MGILFAIVLILFDKTGRMGWIYSWILITIFSLFLTFVAPVVILPLFNKFTPLEDGELKNAIISYSNKQKIVLSKIFKIDGSKRSTKANAYFTGFGKTKRVALFDTLIEDMTKDQIVAVLAHEVGHHKLGHIIKSIIMSILSTGLMLYILSLFINNQGLFDAFQIENISIYGSLILFLFLYRPIAFLFEIFFNIYSRKIEFEADNFAKRTQGDNKHLIEALKKLTVKNLSNLTPHRLKVFLEYSHPTVLQRIVNLRKSE